MADNYFVVERKDLPEWHKLYKKGSTEEVNPFIEHADISVGPISYEYEPYMIASEGSAGYTNFWKKSDLFETSEGGLVYSGTALGLNGSDKLTQVPFLISTGEYIITRPYNSSGGYDLVITGYKNGHKTTLISGTCPTCFFFELCGPGGGGSSKYDDSGVTSRAGNGGGGGGFIAGIIDFSVATSGVYVKVGDPGEGGTYEGATATNFNSRRKAALGGAGGSALIRDIKVFESNAYQDYYCFTANGGAGGEILPYNSSIGDHTIITSPAAGGTCTRSNRDGYGTKRLSSVPSVAGGIIVLHYVDGAPGGVNYNDWSSHNPNGYPKSTSLSSTSFELAPGVTGTSKIYTATTGGYTCPDNYSSNCGGGGASMLGNGGIISINTPGIGGGGSGGLTNTTTYDYGQDGGSGYFKLYYDTI